MALALPNWITTLAGWCAIFSTAVIFLSIALHLRSYRKPFQQRLMIRIQLIIPLFALSCYCMLVSPRGLVTKYIIEPLREIYEAFVIYTFFSLLINMLGGTKNIIIMTSGRPPVSHPGMIRYILPDMDISDPPMFLAIKRGILQYVWLKPVLCFGILLAESLGWYDVNDMGIRSLYLWFTLVYNFSVSLSLYCLAMFWKILWLDLKPFNPIGKFLCVKLIIFASYWQGVLLAILNFAGVLPPNDPYEQAGAPNIGISIQNALLCVELVAFAVGHWVSFTYRPFTISKVPNGRLLLKYAIRDMMGIKDLVIDFRLTFYGDYYKDYKHFNSVDASVAHPDASSRMSRINQGLRYSSDGKQKHWLAQQSQNTTNTQQSRNSIESTSERIAFHGSKARSNSNQTASNYAGLIELAGTSMRAIYPGSPKVASSSSSPAILPDNKSINTIMSLEDDMEDQVRQLNPAIDYGSEFFNEDEQLYIAANSLVTNYNLDQADVKDLIKYPIADEMIGGHAYGYKVQKLRADRMRLLQQNSGGDYGGV